LSLIDSLTILVTDRCNFSCDYCFQNNPVGKDVSLNGALAAIEYAYDNSRDELNILFSGGEPLLKFGLIKGCIEFVDDLKRKHQRSLSYSIITNGSLVDSNILSFLSKHKFYVQYSFDVYLRDDSHEIEKFEQGNRVLKKLLNSKDISLSTNTVFSPETVDKIFESVVYLIDSGVQNIGIGLDQTVFWDKNSLDTFRKELSKVKKIVVENYKSTGNILVDYFDLMESNGIKMCSAGGGKLVITPNGEFWGCQSFYFLDWNKCEEKRGNYLYGNITDLKKENFNKKRNDIRSNYKKFKTDNFRTDKSKCFLCDYLEECIICPTQKDLSIGKKRSLFHVPDYICEINKIIIDLNREFKKEVK